MARKPRQIPAQTRERLAAAGALGLGYWAGHPRAGWIWAVGDDQQAYAIEIDRKGQRARIIYEPAKAWAAAKAGPWADYRIDDWQLALAPPAGEEIAA